MSSKSYSLSVANAKVTIIVTFAPMKKSVAVGIFKLPKTKDTCGSVETRRMSVEKAKAAWKACVAKGYKRFA